ncbi:B-cell receptor CD22-like [Caenorhabditis elegans]|nr:B-cell receptor CD22-like [Caenorhabditis elegans]VVC12343.1 B-cell receptor CD22-like [Caenorhabditis elegans]
MKAYWGKAGAPITLPCSISLFNEESFSLDWRKDGQLILSAFGQEQGHVTPTLQGRLARDGFLGITIHSVTDGDAGVYQCIVTKFSKQPTRPEKGLSAKLVVNVPPVIISPSKNAIIHKKVGADLIFECKAEGAPSPEITWSRNEQIISTSPVLTLSNLEEGDKGLYTCLAVNIEGNSTSSIDVRFTKATILDLIPLNKTVIEGSNVFWHCHANAQATAISYSWLFEKKPIKTTSLGLRSNIRSGDLSLQDVRKSDSGWYTCEAKNSAGETTSSTAYLHVFYPPEPLSSHQPVQTVASGRNTTVSCDVIANPTPTSYTWSKNGHYLPTQASSHIIISYAKPGDGGIYGCQADNIAGKGSIVETHLIVAEPPVFTVAPPSEIKVRLGDQVSIPCQGFGDPMPIVYWIRDKKRINQSTLTFKKVEHLDHGAYECVVANSVETISTRVMLLVEITKPQMASSIKFTCLNSSSMRISWTPGYNGGFDQTFAVHAQNDVTLQWTSIKTSLNETILDHLEPFVSYRVSIESVNAKGSTNSTTYNRRSCTSLHAPDKLYFCGYNELCWTAAEGASSYRIESRTEPSKNFQPLAEVLETYYRLGKDVDETKQTIFRVRSTRPSYPPSEPSNALRYGIADNVDLPIFMLAAVFGLLFCFACGLFAWRCFHNKNKKSKRRKSRSNSTPSKTYQDYGRFTYGDGSSSSQPGTETYYEPSLRLLDDHEWRGPRDLEPVAVRYPPSLAELDYDIGEDHPIDDMFRDRYILGVQDPPAQLYQDLRLERLRREYKQSQI